METWLTHMADVQSIVSGLLVWIKTVRPLHYANITQGISTQLQLS